MSPVYLSSGIGLLTLVVSFAAIIYRSGATEARLDSRIGALERRVNTIPNIPAEYVPRPECERRTSDFCRKIELVRTEIAATRTDLLKAMTSMDEKREKARDDSDEVGRQLAALRALFDQHLRRYDT